MLCRLITIVTLIRLKWCAGEQKVTELHSDHTATILPAGDTTEKKFLQILGAQLACTCMQDCVRSSFQDVLPWK